jgi:hypothetical protein
MRTARKSKILKLLSRKHLSYFYTQLRNNDENYLNKPSFSAQNLPPAGCRGCGNSRWFSGPKPGPWQVHKANKSVGCQRSWVKASGAKQAKTGLLSWFLVLIERL